MRIPRLYVDAPLGLHRRITLDDAAAHRLTRVLRLRDNAAIRVFNGRGPEYEATLQRHDRGWCILPVAERDPAPPSPLRITLAQSVTRSERMDFALQKAVELGVSFIQPIMAERSTLKAQPARLHNRHAHWLRTVIQACEQCGRSDVPVLHEPREMQAWMAENRTAVVLRADAAHSLNELALNGIEASLLVGPEGGFSDGELRCAQTLGLAAAHLGPRTLRTETTALVALTILQTRFGDLGRENPPGSHHARADDGR